MNKAKHLNNAAQITFVDRIFVDVKVHLFLGDDGIHKKCFLFSAVDCKSRTMIMIKTYSNDTQENAIAFLSHIIDDNNFKLTYVVTDHSVVFQCKFHTYCKQEGIQHETKQPSLRH